VKEFELDPTADVWIFLDMDQSVHVAAPWTPPSQESYRGPFLLAREPRQLTLIPSTEEYGVTVAASLARHFLRRDRAVGLATYAQRREIVQADRGERQLDRILETLAVIKAQGEMPFAHMIALEGRHLTRSITIIAITPSISHEWVIALRELRRRGVRSMAVLLAADTFGPAPSWHETVRLLYANNILTYVVRRGDAIDAALAEPAHLEVMPSRPHVTVFDDGRDGHGEARSRP
jgi:uncharacterized protein (DUF58 family)